jgi:PilZ domain
MEIAAPPPIAEKRSGTRYRGDTPLSFSVHHEQGVAESSGRLVNISNTGILFHAENSPPVGSKIKLSIPWPVRGTQIFTMNLAITGWVVRRQGNHTAVKIDRYDFEAA